MSDETHKSSYRNDCVIQLLIQVGLTEKLRHEHYIMMHAYCTKVTLPPPPHTHTYTHPPTLPFYRQSEDG